MSGWADAPATASDYWSTDEAHDQFRRTGIAVVQRFLNKAVAATYADLLAEKAEGWPRVVKTVDNEAARGLRSAWVANEDRVRCDAPELAALTGPIRLVAEAVVRRPVIESPHPGSACTAKVYGPGDEQGPHRDSNPLTGLLLLRGAPPMFERGPVVTASPGDLVVFQGRRWWHYSPPPPGCPGYKMVFVVNLYHPEDVWRPADQDARIYGAPT